MYRIVLRVTGVDLEDDELFEHLEQVQGDLIWSEISGRTLVTLYADCANPVGKAVEVARRVTAACPGAQVTEVDPELVSISDIAQRAGVSREAVRLWADGHRGPGDFPTPLGSVGGGARGSMRVWAWSDVNAWLRQHYGLGDEVSPLDSDQRAETNAELRRARHVLDAEWEAVRVPVPPTVVRAARPTQRPSRVYSQGMAKRQILNQGTIPALSSSYSPHVSKGPR